MRDLVKDSKFLSLILRHKPETIGIRLDDSGWVEIDNLLEALARHKRPLTREKLMEIVATNDKKRFAISADGKRIRASQGHSLDIALGYAPCVPPAVLYHGTASRFRQSIEDRGLLKGDRHHVHMTASVDTARAVGSRHGKPVILSIDAGAMHRDGYEFFLSDNGVWLTDHVPASYIDFG